MRLLFDLIFGGTIISNTIDVNPKMNRTTTKPGVFVAWVTEKYIRDALGASLRSGHRCLHMTHRAYQFFACDIRSATYALIVIHHDTPYKRVLVYR